MSSNNANSNEVEKRRLHEATHRADAALSGARGWLRALPSLTTADGSLSAVITFFGKFTIIASLGGIFTACLVAFVRSRAAESLPSEHVALAAAAALCWALNIPPTIALAASQSGYDNANSREQKSHSTG